MRFDRRLLAAARRVFRTEAPCDSSGYWEGRYARGGCSGVGSYGKFAEFKAEVLNDLVAREGVERVIELGCGDGAQLALARYPSYVGLDVSASIVRQVIRRFADDPSKSFFAFDPDAFADRHGVFQADLALSLDVVYHLVEDAAFERHMQLLFGVARRLVVVYSSDDASLPCPAPHVRHRCFTAWVREHAPEWQLDRRIENRFPYRGDYREGSWSDFWVFRRAPAPSGSDEPTSGGALGAGVR